MKDFPIERIYEKFICLNFKGKASKWLILKRVDAYSRISKFWSVCIYEKELICEFLAYIKTIEQMFKIILSIFSKVLCHVILYVSETYDTFDKVKI